jgi:hypothetical protein
MKKKVLSNKLSTILRGSALVAVWGLCTPAQALRFEKGEWLFNVDTTLTGGAQWRTESRDKNMSTAFESANFHDGNNNFDTGLVSAKGSFILEVGGEYEDFSFFIRGDGLYDYVYENEDTDMSQQNYLTYNGAIPNGGDVKRGDFPDDTLDEHGKRLRLLDAFITYNFDLGNQSGGVRLGQQVIAWGEATFYQGVNARQNPIDGGVALSPGATAKEIFLPSPALDLKWNFTDSIDAEAYYKLEWEKSTLPGVGSYLGASDIVDPGAQRILLGPLGSAPTIKAVEPDDEGQFGLALRYLTDGGTNFDLSFTRSHNFIPGVETVIDLGDSSNSFSREVYLDDVDFWQLSTSTNISEAQVYADIAYSDNAPFVFIDRFINDAGQLVSSSMERGEYYQAVIGMTDVYTAFPWLSEQISLVVEATYQGNDLGKSSKEKSLYANTDDAWGYQFLLTLKYFSVIPGMDVDVKTFFKHDVDGYGNGLVMNNGLIEDVKTASFGFDAFYLSNWQFSGKYAWYFGNDKPEDRTLDDRDNVALSVKYAF